MPCYHPLTAYRSSNGAVFFTQLKRNGGGDTLQLPCGQCIGCRLERSRQWAIRCMHEAQMNQQNCFLTLTYADENLPKNNSLCYRDFQNFMKRYRKAIHPDKIRFYMCGEYGEKTDRPHYHACIFGHDFNDKTYHSKTATGFKIYTSTLLDRLWHHGHASIGCVSFETAAYVARYVMKKVNGQAAESYYERLDTTTGEIIRIEPEFAHMSLKPGIGASWLEKYQDDIYPNGLVVVNGVEVKPPKYYDKKYKKSDFDNHELILYRRYQDGKKNYHDNIDERLAVKEIVTAAKVKQLKRSQEI